ncbi:unnamed protein product [Clonostachys byssicola]|uniref:Uncharacterized protein n=1 Tax=Clonostachys byssicola TaxID=160290 RepID=A0A9N9Y108_9HYPO|nr:unnamed protein product [Clonostachys byssicola]
MNSYSLIVADKMSILSLPNELIHLLLINCILVRGVVRGLRLRLVCKRFNECFTPALHDSRILDDLSAPHIGRHWWMRNDRYGSSRLWQQYLVARVLSEADPDVGRFVEIRKAAETLYDRIDGPVSFEEIVNGLCWLGVERGTNRPGEKRLWLKPETDLWRIHPSTVEDVPEPPREPPSNPQLNLLCAAAYFDQATPIVSGVMFSNQYFSRTPAIYDFITDSFANPTDTEPDRQKRQRNQIAQYARYGNLAMVRHVAGSSSKIRAGTHGRFGNPLYRACRGCYEDIVDFLLDRDVDHDDEVLTACTRAGCVEIMRKVLKREITFETDFAPRELLTEITKREDVPMLQFILEQGYKVTLRRHNQAMKMAVAQGLESMIDCLNGLEIVEDPPYFSERYSHSR